MYAQRFDLQASLEQNIEREILTKGQVLFEEVPFLLRAELREPRVYQSILSAIATGSSKFGEISSKTGLEKTHLSGYLASLVELGFVAREVPITEAMPDKSRKGRYLIADPFIQFWYRFVYANYSLLEAGRAATVAKERVFPKLHDYFSRQVEVPLADCFAHGSLGRYLPFEPAYIGRHWSPQEEFDFVALDQGRRQAFVVEVKWSRQPVAASLGSELRRKVAQCEALRGLNVTTAVVSRNGIGGKGGGGSLLIDLSQEKA